MEERGNCIQKDDMSCTEDTLAAQAIAMVTLNNTLPVKALKAPGLDSQAVMLMPALQSQQTSGAPVNQTLHDMAIASFNNR